VRLFVHVNLKVRSPRKAALTTFKRHAAKIGYAGKNTGMKAGHCNGT
jgi:hypothetical protein